uniref:Uncharacterized protein n=1 Tax=Arundo donax TaxID=35708 RepID=A0A0A9BQ65_ARUDO
MHSWRLQHALLATCSTRVVTITLQPLPFCGKALLIISHDGASHKSSTTIKYLLCFRCLLMLSMMSCTSQAGDGPPIPNFDCMRSRSFVISGLWETDTNALQLNWPPIP